MNTIKLCFTCILLLGTVVVCKSQTINFDYDASGNRTSRTIPGFKSTAQHDTSNVEEPKELKDKVGNQDILIYPNPVRGELTIKIPELNEEENNSFSLYNQDGKLILKNDKLSTINTIYLSDLKPGIYFLNICYGDNTVQWKLIKE